MSSILGLLTLGFAPAFIGELIMSGGQTAGALLGIALLIFIHEGGHFLAAKYCGVAVEVFSLGFGQRLWGFVYKGTDYRLSLLPLGGYVKMLGQDDGDPLAARTDREDDFRNKTVSQRSLILVGGVAVNAVFAAVAFVVAFWIGVPFPSPEIGYAARGGPAEGKLQAGDRVLRIDGQEIIAFNDIPQIVAFSGGTPMHFEVQRLVAGKPTVVKFEIAAVKGKDDRFPLIRVGGLYVVGKVEPGTATEKAGLKKGDRILSYRDAAGTVTPFTRPSGLATLAEERPGGSIAMRIERPRFDELGNPVGIEKSFDLKLPCPAKEHWSFGFDFRQDLPRIGRVLAGTPAALGGLKADDRLVSVEGVSVDTMGVPALVQAKCLAARKAKKPTLGMLVERDGESGKAERVSLQISVPEPKGFAQRFTLGFEFGADRVGKIEPGGPLALANEAAAKADPKAVLVQPGDRLVRVRTRRRFGIWWVGGAKGFEHTVQAIADSLEGKECEFSFEREGRRHSMVLAGRKAPKDRYGNLEFAFQSRRIIVRRGFSGGLALGVYSTTVSMRQVLQMLRSLVVRRDVSVRELAGPIRIVSIATKVADGGFGKLIWFLALLSVNLAVLNILPIPVLDGGHLLLLGIEWLKGGPVPDRVVIISQYAGLFLILALILTVSFNDIVSLWSSV